MYIDESGGDHEIRVEMDGQEYTAGEDYDYDHDGQLDSAVADAGAGEHIVYTDTDHDGQADLLTRIADDGHVVEQARFDPHTGQWVEAAGPHGTDAPGDSARHAGDIVVDTPEGGKSAGPATEDTDGDGRPDTAVGQDDKGDTWLYTDTNGDGHAEVAVEITGTGEVTVFQHSGDHQWMESEHGHLDADGHYNQDGVGGGAAPADPADDSIWDEGAASGETGRYIEGVVRIDSSTGQWISLN
ncbi:hypothetical protein [Gandjariella thermophila]|uniref:Uncharacterized protein n=1 Tax=Gandjariella thermophila TaxID=1931992 RepID=A0A4D4J2Z5_9PSEU|nr:hypothetical protein [Gandjariella thermophila]GDY30861.1 hypothetical protein GTS_24940 [Gandjariella thermophila]